MGFYNPPQSAIAGLAVGGVLSGTLPNPGFATGPTFTAPVTLTGVANQPYIAATTASVTGANTTSFLSLTGTWNTSGVVTGLFVKAVSAI